MKKLIAIMALTLSIAICITSPKTAFAVTYSDYAVVASENTAFYSDASHLFVKFYLPYSYSVKIVSIGADFSRVVYMDDSTYYPMREGYVKNADLMFLEQAPSKPYPNITVTTIYDEVLFADVEKTQPKTVITAGSTAVFYGTMNSGSEEYLYVYSQGYIGYVRKNSFKEFSIPLNALPVSESSIQSISEASVTAPATPPSSGESGGYTVIIVTVAVIAAVSLVYLAVRPEKNKLKEQVFHDDDD